MENLIERYKDRLPESYLKFISENRRFSGYLDDEFGSVSLWDLNFLNQVFDVICEYHDNIGKDYFPIGSDGGGDNICIKLTSPTKELFFIESISISDEYARFYCDNFEKLYSAVKQHLLK